MPKSSSSKAPRGPTRTVSAAGSSAAAGSAAAGSSADGSAANAGSAAAAGSAAYLLSQARVNAADFLSHEIGSMLKTIPNDGLQEIESAQSNLVTSILKNPTIASKFVDTKAAVAIAEFNRVVSEILTNTAHAWVGAQECLAGSTADRESNDADLYDVFSRFFAAMSA